MTEPLAAGGQARGSGRVDRRPRRVEPRIAGGLVLAATGIAFWLVLRLAVPWTANQPTTIPYFASLLAAIGLALLVTPRGAILLLLALGLAWRSIEWRVALALNGILVSQQRGQPVGQDLVETWTPLLVVAGCFALAIWRRPPGRTAAGAPILATRVVNRLALPAIFLGPPAGLVAWLYLAPGDVYGRLFGVGLVVGCLGLLLFTAYAGLHRLVGRPPLAAVLAAAWSVAALALFLVA